MRGVTEINFMRMDAYPLCTKSPRDKSADAPRLKVAADTPEAAHGDTTEKPTESLPAAP
jgi:hypothetical protein